MLKKLRPIDPSELQVGKRIRIKCPRVNEIFRTDCGYIDGEVVDLFDGGSKMGMQIDIRNKTQWWRWIPSIDGGTCEEEE
jgi:hypothetical protein